jgi:thymidylate synthase (FAD)
MRVRIIGKTRFFGSAASAITEGVWDEDPSGTDAANLAEFAGRACYQSWTRPNPETATNEGYLDHIIEVEHNTVLEHGTMSFYIDQVSRSFTHELIRHRHNSYSQLSQRFVLQGKPEVGKDPFVTPQLFKYSDVAGEILKRAWSDAMDHYNALMGVANALLSETEEGTSRKKEAREAARCVLPNMTPTAIVVTGNHSAWRDFLKKRGTLQADAEIREVACLIYHHLRFNEPNLYRDFTRMIDDRGRRYLVHNAQN